MPGKKNVQYNFEFVRVCNKLELYKEKKSNEPIRKRENVREKKRIFSSSSSFVSKREVDLHNPKKSYTYHFRKLLNRRIVMQYFKEKVHRKCVYLLYITCIKMIQVLSFCMI